MTAHSDRNSTASVWLETAMPRFDRLQRNLTVDVVVVGGGVTGITTAYLLKRAGARVALLERGRIAAADSARTTAHLTYVTDYRLQRLVKSFGKDAVRAFWEGGAAAIDQIAGHVRDLAIDCDFGWVPGFLHERSGEADRDERERLQAEATLAGALGFDATYVDAIPGGASAGIRFNNQAKFHPRRYLAALARSIDGDGSHVFEDTELEAVSREPLAVRANGYTLQCAYLVMATHNPLAGSRSALGAALFQTKLSLYTSYVLRAALPDNILPAALFWDTSDPYEYLRIDASGPRRFTIFGGEDVKTGQEGDAQAVFARLERRLRQRLPQADITHRWMGQVIETDDGLPFIGEYAQGEFIATGFAGNGFTLGTLAAMMASDRYLQRTNPWADLFRLDRKPFHGGLWRYVQENVDYPYYLLRDRLASADDGDVSSVQPGTGRIVRLDGKKVAAFRSTDGTLTLCSPVCTHLGCLVRWNTADHTWDCPCHGSRFHSDGRVMSGPAEAPLQRLEVPTDQRRAES